MSDIEKAELVARKEKAGEEAHPAGGHGGHGVSGPLCVEGDGLWRVMVCGG